MHSYAAEIEERPSHGRMVCARLLLEQEASFPRPLQLTRKPFSGEPRRTRGYWTCKQGGVTGLHREISGGGLQFAPDHRARTGNRRVRRPMPGFPCEGCRVYTEPCAPALRALPCAPWPCLVAGRATNLCGRTHAPPRARRARARSWAFINPASPCHCDPRASESERVCVCVRARDRANHGWNA